MFTRDCCSAWWLSRLDILSNQLENKHASKLEWIIIWLIVVEVVIEVFWNILVKDLLHLVSDRTTS